MAGASSPFMKILVTGICGFVGASLAAELKARFQGVDIFGIDNLTRPGSELNKGILRKQGIRFFHGDIRNGGDMETLPAADWVVEAAANPSVLAGVDGLASSRQLTDHNLVGTLNVLEYCKKFGAGFILISTSRVYSIPALAALPLVVRDHAFTYSEGEGEAVGISPAGISEAFSTTPPVSLYGATKLASEIMALEYGQTFNLPVFVNRCGVLAGAGQFGRPDQGIFSYWIHSYCQRRPLRYIGFGGHGHQVRDCLHPEDLAVLLERQMTAGPEFGGDRVLNIGGGPDSAISLRQLSDWCAARFQPHNVVADETPRPFDLPWMVMDASRARELWGWKPERSLAGILEEIALHAEKNPAWLDVSSVNL